MPRIKKVYIRRPTLPSEYQRVEYIQSDGNQIIDTGVYGKGNTSILTKLVVSGRKGNYDMYYGAYGDDNVRAFFIQSNYPTNNKIRVVNYSNTGSLIKYVDSINNLQFNTEYIIEHTNTSFSINGTLQGTMAASSFTTSYTLCAFGIHGKNGSLNPSLIGKIYYFKIYESGDLVRDFIPCYRKSDNVIGLYDNVTGTFFTNSGTGTFSKGNDITSRGIQVWPNGWDGPNENTVGYYPLNGNANDYSGNNRNGTATSMSYKNIGNISVGVFGTGYISLPNIGLSFSRITVNIWMCSIQNENAERSIFFLAPSGDNKNLSIAVNSRIYHTYRWNSSGGTVVDLNSGVNVCDGQWHNIVFMRDGAVHELYVDGLIHAVNACNYGIERGSASAIGCNGFHHNANYQGYASNIIVESTLRDPDKIKNYYDSTKHKYGL